MPNLFIAGNTTLILIYVILLIVFTVVTLKSFILVNLVYPSIRTVTTYAEAQAVTLHKNRDIVRVTEAPL